MMNEDTTGGASEQWPSNGGVGELQGVGVASGTCPRGVGGVDLAFIPRVVSLVFCLGPAALQGEGLI